MRFVPLILLLAVSMLTQCAHNSRIQKPEQITVPELRDHLAYLASDSLKGRKPGTKEGRLAAQYIRDDLVKNGLKPLGEDGFQYFDVVTSVEAGENNRLEFDGFMAEAGKDFTPLSFSKDTLVSADVVFVGYGFDIKTDSITWNDYDGLDVNNKLVIILRGDPDYNQDSSIFEAYAGLRKKVLTAKDHRAAGVLFVSGVQFDKDDELIGVSFDKSRAAAEVSVAHIKRSLADTLLSEKGSSIAGLENKLNEQRKPLSFSLNKKITLQTEIKRNTVTTQNVVALLTGSDPALKNEIIVIGAHYDHLGMGGPGSGSRRPDTSAVHNGADDNASGVAAILEVIEQLAANRESIKRSVLFMAFGAEEMGLLGSKFFTANPAIDLKDIKFMFNLDMVGRMNPDTSAFTIGGAGTAVGLKNIISRLAAADSLHVQQSDEGYGPSDHAAFYMQDIPVAFVFTGVHDDYHTPADDIDKINFEGEKIISDFVYGMVTEIANRELALVYQEAGPKVQPTSGRRKFKVTLGIMPDFSGVAKKGLRADAVIPDRPAFRAGMKKGDVIVAIEGKPVKNIYDYMGRLGEFKKGQRISVDVIRGGKKVVLIVDL